jgi:hypothetical protein
MGTLSAGGCLFRLVPHARLTLEASTDPKYTHITWLITVHNLLVNAYLYKEATKSSCVTVTRFAIGKGKLMSAHFLMKPDCRRFPSAVCLRVHLSRLSVKDLKKTSSMLWWAMGCRAAPYPGSIRGDPAT